MINLIGYYLKDLYGILNEKISEYNNIQNDEYDKYKEQLLKETIIISLEIEIRNRYDIDYC